MYVVVSDMLCVSYFFLCPVSVSSYMLCVYCLKDMTVVIKLDSLHAMCSCDLCCQPYIHIVAIVTPDLCFLD